MNTRNAWWSMLFVALLARGAAAQVLYTEDFPYPAGATGDQPISNGTGWVNDVIERFNRLYAGALFAFSGVATADAFYTTTVLDSGATGAAFPSIDPTAYPFGVTLAVDLQNGFSPDEVRSRFAVQINNGSWYVSRTALPVPTTANGPLANYSIPFLPSAANWNNLTLTGTGVTATPGAAAVIGGPAASPLTGNITGAGVIVTYGENGLPITGGGTHNIDNFQIRQSSRPGDVNLDTFINLADLQIIRQNFRQAVGSITLGDLTSDGFVNFDDFRLWKNNYVPGPGEPAGGTVPEPSGAVLATAALAALAARRRRRLSA
jgi:MYXO-CTERM domain-containing protein